MEFPFLTRFHRGEDLLNDDLRFGLILNEYRTRPFPYQLGESLFSAIQRNKAQSTDTARRRSQQAFPEWAGMKAINQLQVFSIFFVITRGYRLKADKQVMQAAWAGETRIEAGVEYAARRP